MSEAAMDVAYLASCAVRGAVPEEARVGRMDLDAVYALASRHMITATVAFALESAGCRDQRSGTAIAIAMRKTALFDQAWAEVKGRLEDAGIWYMPLKGAVLKGLYPRYGMREFADHDVLFDASAADEVKAIMEDLGFEAGYFGISNHDCYYRQPCLNFEMHRALFGPSHEEGLYEYYRDVEGRLIEGAGLERRFTPEDFYLYLLSHEYKHYAGGGTGLRSLLDTYVYLSQVDLDMAYVRSEADKLGIREFEERNRSLSMHLVSGTELAGPDREMLGYILSSGTYGTIVHQVENRMRRKGWGKVRYALDRFLVPISRKDRDYESFAGKYPLFYRHKVLLPLLPLYRTLRAMRTGRFGAEVRAIRNANRP